MDDFTSVPKYGQKIKLDHVYPDNWRQDRIPPFHQWWEMIRLIIRYVFYWIKIKYQGRRVIMDYLDPKRAKQIYGVPIGGIGSGTIGRGYKGEFCRYQLRPGLYDYNTVDANQFIITIKDDSEITLFQSVLSTYERKSGTLQSWKSLVDGSKCNYTALYPRAWTEYDLSEYGVKLTCRQISPVIPHNYTDSSLPCAVFVWDVENISDKNLIVTIAFTFKNGIGVKKVDKESTSSSKPFSYLDNEGVMLYHQIDKMNCSYALAARQGNGVNVTKCVYFDPNGDGKEPWNQLLTNGRFDKISDKKFDNVFGEMAVGIAAQTKVSSKSKQNIEITLVWDMPVVTFWSKKQKYLKYYSKFFGNDCTLKIVDRALKNYLDWEREIYKWQAPILDNLEYPDWYKGALFNETYFVSDGGSIWVSLEKSESESLPDNDPRQTYGRYGYLEGHEYRMINTYDVHFYASFALSMNWPKIQEIIQYDIKDAIFQEVPICVTALLTGKDYERKIKNSVPHDLGDPGEEGFALINAYPIQDVSEWKDLNVKFVLQVFRDYKTRNDNDRLQYLEDMYGALKVVMTKSITFDTDGDGLIENSGLPDQTYDSWVMTGASAYCGGLWLAALYAMTIISDILKKPDDKELYQKLLDKGKRSFEKKLWNGTYYNFDEFSRDKDVIMSDQLCGHWYLRASGVKHEVFPEEKVVSSLKAIFNNNVLCFGNGKLGSVNGCFPDGKVDKHTIQSEEVWPGVTYAVASTMIQEGLLEEAWKTAGGLSTSMVDRLGLCFETPEALYEEKYYRAIGYMRPLSIWSIQMALDQRK